MGEMRICDCTCHAGPYAACDHLGGCRTTGCGRTNGCVTCVVYRPDTQPRQPNYPPVCDSDRALLDRHLVDIANLHADLCNPEPPIVDGRQHERFGTVYFEGGIRHVFSRGMRPSDPLATLGGVAPINSRSTAPGVSGSRERPIPINTGAHDLTAPARVPSLAPSSRGPHQPASGWPEDQIGHLATATILDQWARDIRDTLHPDQHLPPARVDELAAWLRARLTDACDRHPAIAEFADELKALRGTLRGLAGQTEPNPEPCEGVACSRCDLRALYRRPGDTYRAECGGCGQLFTDAEYGELTGEQAKAERNSRTPKEVYALLRRV